MGYKHGYEAKTDNETLSAGLDRLNEFIKLTEELKSKTKEGNIIEIAIGYNKDEDLFYYYWQGE